MLSSWLEVFVLSVHTNGPGTGPISKRLHFCAGLVRHLSLHTRRRKMMHTQIAVMNRATPPTEMPVVVYMARSVSCGLWVGTGGTALVVASEVECAEKKI